MLFMKPPLPHLAASCQVRQLLRPRVPALQPHVLPILNSLCPRIVLLLLLLLFSPLRLALGSSWRRFDLEGGGGQLEEVRGVALGRLEAHLLRGVRVCWWVCTWVDSGVGVGVHKDGWVRGCVIDWYEDV